MAPVGFHLPSNQQRITKLTRTLSMSVSAPQRLVLLAALGHRRQETRVQLRGEPDHAGVLRDRRLVGAADANPGLSGRL